MISDAVEMVNADGTRLAAAGVTWDVVKVRRHLAVRAIERIPEPGAVAVDPWPVEPALYFFVPAGSAGDWDVPQTTALGLDSHVVLPPDRKEAPPGPYWLTSPGRGLTSTSELRQALTYVVNCAPGRRDQRPPDVRTMRAASAELFGDDGMLPRWETVQTFAHLFRGHVTLLILAVEDLAVRRPNGDVCARSALASVDEARRHLDEIEAIDLAGEIRRVQRLGRSMLALCDHFEALNGLLLCLVCDEDIKGDEKSVSYDKVSPSGGAATAGRIHVRCANKVRRS
ncbi:DUF6415 family natural product biosynthesis protein [Streptomyces hokutonensis]|uniref:DUF6415 family natural product biosynthesis protein n=1 Tax=Streptomyces hokutonensis TaxID=1306990 RepID=UPI003802635B